MTPYIAQICENGKPIEEHRPSQGDSGVFEDARDWLADAAENYGSTAVESDHAPRYYRAAATIRKWGPGQRHEIDLHGTAAVTFKLFPADA